MYICKRKFKKENYERSNVHQNVTITGNRFVNMKDSAVFAYGVTGITVTDNEISNCSSNNENKLSDSGFDITLINCDEVTLDNNYNSYGKEVSLNNKYNYSGDSNDKV